MTTKELEVCALHAVESIIDAWEDWDAEAQQAAQQDQDDRSWRFVMRSHIATCLYRAFDLPMGDESAAERERLKSGCKKIVDEFLQEFGA